jgi:hypothetical protein
VVELADVRILALGTYNRPTGPFYINNNAKNLLSGYRPDDLGNAIRHDAGGMADARPCRCWHSTHPRSDDISISVSHPIVAATTELQLSRESRTMHEDGRRWVGSMMYISLLRSPLQETYLYDRLVAQIIGPQNLLVDSESTASDDGTELVTGPGRRQYASLHWVDLWAVAPWMQEKVTRKIDGAALAN